MLTNIIIVLDAILFVFCIYSYVKERNKNADNTQ